MGYTENDLRAASEAWDWAVENLVPDEVKELGSWAVNGWMLNHTIDTTVTTIAQLANAGEFE